jgi:very-short-patch-repair endonuclease
MICKICNESFTTNIKLSGHIRSTHKISIKEYYDTYIKQLKEGICIECGKETKFLGLGEGYRTYCCNKCSKQSQQTKNKTKETNIKKYGCNHTQVLEIKEKRKKTCIEKYGGNAPSCSNVIKEKMKKTCIEKYGVDNIFKSKFFIQNNLQQIQQKLQKEYITKKKNNTFNTSNIEQELGYMLKQDIPNILFQYKSEEFPFSVDYYISEINLYIDLNASWTHGGKIYDENDNECIKQLSEWKEKSKTSKFYKNAIYTWTILDVKKRTYNVNRLEVFSNDIKEAYGIIMFNILQQYNNIKNYKYDNISKKCIQAWNNKTIKDKQYIQEKRENTTCKNIGIKNPFLSSILQKEYVQIKKDKYGDTFKKLYQKRHYNDVLLNLPNIVPMFTLDEYNGTINRQRYNWKCTECNTVFDDNVINGHIPKCPKCYPKYNGSKPQQQMEEWLKIIITAISNQRYYYDRNKYYELDICIPDKKIGIEFNGIFHHSEKDKLNKDGSIHYQGKSSMYHLTKTNFFTEQGIQLLHIWDNEWINKQDIVKSIILSKIGKIENKIYARKCSIKEITSKESNEFLENNHLQGKDNSSIRLGLYYDDELVALMTLGKSRYNKKYEYELYRFACKTYTSIIGGFSKLLKYFIQKYKPNSIITYADKRYSIGNVYGKNGFTFLHDSSPNYFYTKDYQILESRVKYQKHKLKNILETYDDTLTEWENMQLNGYDRVWDCGNSTWIWNKNN